MGSAPDSREGSPPRAASPLAVSGERGFTLAEVVVALGLTLVLSGIFLALFRVAHNAFRLEPELAAMRLDARAALDRITADLLRAGSGLPVEIPVFSDLGRAGNRNPDGLDFLAAPERLAAVGFEPVTGFDGREVTLAVPDSRFASGGGSSSGSWAVVFNDDEMLPRWAFGRVEGTSGGGGLGISLSGTPALTGGGEARVRLAPRNNSWHFHFNAALDGDTFSPGGGGGLVERGLESVLGGVISSVLPGAAPPLLTQVTTQVVGSVLEAMARRARSKAPGIDPGTEEEDGDGFGLFGLGQPGLVPVSRIRYWVAPPGAGSADSRRVLMRRVNETPPQPVGFVEDLQVRYLTGEDAEVIRDDPPPFIGDMKTAADLGRHIVRGVEVAVRVRSVERRLAASPGRGVSAGGADDEDFLTRTYRRRVGFRVSAAGVDRRRWEERMQLKALPTEIPRIGPLRFIPLPW